MNAVVAEATDFRVRQVIIGNVLGDLCADMAVLTIGARQGQVPTMRKLRRAIRCALRVCLCESEQQSDEQRGKPQEWRPFHRKEQSRQPAQWRNCRPCIIDSASSGRLTIDSGHTEDA
jgi:hypothetical protein